MKPISIVPWCPRIQRHFPHRK